MAVGFFCTPPHSLSDAGLAGAETLPNRARSQWPTRASSFLDEMPEFNRRTLEVLSQPLEEGN